MVGAALCKVSPYSTGLWSASPITSENPCPDVSMTITIGTKKRTTNTAIKMPTVKNNFCQNGDMRTKMRLLITALSKLNVTSRITKIVNSHSDTMPPCANIHAPSAAVNKPDSQKILNGCVEVLAMIFIEYSRIFILPRDPVQSLV